MKKDKYGLPGMGPGAPVQQVGREMYMNGYMPNGYPMMPPDPHGYQQHMGQMQMQYPMYGAPQIQPNAPQMTSGSYMNGNSSYTMSMAPYMQPPSAHSQMPQGVGAGVKVEGQGQQPGAGRGRGCPGDLREMISMYLPGDANDPNIAQQRAQLQAQMQGQYASHQPAQEAPSQQGVTQTVPLTHM